MRPKRFSIGGTVRFLAAENIQFFNLLYAAFFNILPKKKRKKRDERSIYSYNVVISYFIIQIDRNLQIELIGLAFVKKTRQLVA